MANTTRFGSAFVAVQLRHDKHLVACTRIKRPFQTRLLYTRFFSLPARIITAGSSRLIVRSNNGAFRTITPPAATFPHAVAGSPSVTVAVFVWGDLFLHLDELRSAFQILN